ncbi:MAG TPA: hypothetical protein VEJ16_05535 [Alphaproteobacteria bacterium]|nr:hypothetical protein [Alphaproteobacteria bacterium]
MNHARYWLFLIVIGALSSIAPAGSRADDTRPLSPAQIALFESNHLIAIDHPVTLDYVYRHDTEGPQGYTDKVEIEVNEVRPDGKKDVSVEFLTGDRRTYFPPVTDFQGNPLLMYFLEFDVMNLRRETGGSPLYFRNRIREAFVDGAEMHPVKITVDGHEADATEIAIRPFLKLTRPEVARFVDKAYYFVLSDAVPGILFQIRSQVPKQEGAPEVVDSVTYSGERQ